MDKYYRVIFKDFRSGLKYARFYKAFTFLAVVNYVWKKNPFEVVEVKEYNTMPKKHEGERIDPNTITEI